jgi:hypothetical protein
MDIEGIREQLRAWAEELAALRSRWVDFQECLPLTAPEASQESPGTDPDVLTEVWAVIGDSVRNALDPLMRDFRAAAEYSPGQPGGRSARSALGRLLDLNAESEVTRRLLYRLVVQDNFTATECGDPGGPWQPPYTAEQAGLEIVYLGGRWLATWLKLEVPPGAAESRRRELLVLSESSNKAGTLYYDEVWSDPI